MKLSLHKTSHYDKDSKPVPGDLVASFKGNQNKCISAANKYIKENRLSHLLLQIWTK